MLVRGLLWRWWQGRGHFYCSPSGGWSCMGMATATCLGCPAGSPSIIPVNVHANEALPAWLGPAAAPGPIHCKLAQNATGTTS